MNTSKTRIFIFIKGLGNIPSPLKNCICWTQKNVKTKSLKGVNPLYLLEPYSTGNIFSQMKTDSNNNEKI